VTLLDKDGNDSPSTTHKGLWSASRSTPELHVNLGIVELALG